MLPACCGHFNQQTHANRAMSIRTWRRQLFATACRKVARSQSLPPGRLLQEPAARPMPYRPASVPLAQGMANSYEHLACCCETRYRTAYATISARSCTVMMLPCWSTVVMLSASAVYSGCSDRRRLPVSFGASAARMPGLGQALPAIGIVAMFALTGRTSCGINLA